MRSSVTEVRPTRSDDPFARDLSRAEATNLEGFDLRGTFDFPADGYAERFAPSSTAVPASPLDARAGTGWPDTLPMIHARPCLPILAVQRGLLGADRTTPAGIHPALQSSAMRLLLYKDLDARRVKAAFTEANPSGLERPALSSTRRCSKQKVPRSACRQRRFQIERAGAILRWNAMSDDRGR